jgi:hypothetical protein
MGQPVTVAFTTDAKGVDRWVRNFNGRIYKSVLWAEEPSRSHLLERMGLLTTRFALAAKPDRLTFDIVGMSLLGVPLPRWIRPRCHAFETGQARAFAFDITIEMPPFGRLIHYRGVLSQVVPSQGETLPAHTTSRL